MLQLTDIWLLGSTFGFTSCRRYKPTDLCSFLRTVRAETNYHGIGYRLPALR
ncbi:hypothetical protein [Bacteroides zhangwenhongii]|uniref:hypothetical protein n=1 Tax=Bacteroides zhangwenhongii TaxID=2650157 RepID=UPI0022E5CF20|nr:hypothetical protein [Bacteroides zhangwenhongii]